MPLIEVHLIEDVFDSAQKKQIIEKLTDAIVDKDQPPGIDAALIGSPTRAMAAYARTILLARDEGLFLNVTPILRKKQLIIEVSALTPRSAERRSQRS